ncbi:MAG: Smr/MutS family protein [Burkholderiaceae bacterium]
MAASLKNFTDLKALQLTLKAREKAHAEAERIRLEQAERLEREANIFRASIGEIKPLSVAPRQTPALPLPPPVARQRIADEEAALQASLSDDFSIETLLESDQELSYARSGIGADVVKKLRRGEWVTQDQLDLHGLRTDEAREAVALFLRNATRRGLRCVRIIHGKGLGSVNKEPVLKNKVRNWLVQKEEVMAFCQARAADGGSGALMVLLRGSN